MSPSESPAPGPEGRRRKNSESDAASEGRSSRTGGRRRAGGRRKKEAKRRGPLIAVVAGALVVALVALGVVLYMELGQGGDGEQAAPRTRPAVYVVRDTGSMNEVLVTRETDSRPLNEGELFGDNNTEISSQSIDFTLRDSNLTEDCSAAVWGEPIRSALTEADCTQAGRATYLSDTYFGVVAVFNLADVEGSRAVAASMAAPEGAEGEAEAAEAGQGPGFVLSPSGAEPFDRMGSGYSASDAIVSGHYLVVVWVQPTDSESVDDRVSLSAPLVALANFRDPLYRRMVQFDTSDGGTEGTTGDGTGQGGTGTTGTDGTGTTGDGTGTGTTGEGAGTGTTGGGTGTGTTGGAGTTGTTGTG
ncbi:hypothetical protein [Nocardiopsis halotolerans]|uniref:hypothetical protein n=1 Tax=Nocardiopsis halotolerans TaxID=124252 RepID=UPI000348A5FF|nr:hypothetical protein [Nocardiopsis halotolerans]